MTRRERIALDAAQAAAAFPNMGAIVPARRNPPEIFPPVNALGQHVIILRDSNPTTAPSPRRPR
jgi:hypothetical protein